MNNANFNFQYKYTVKRVIAIYSSRNPIHPIKHFRAFDFFLTAKLLSHCFPLNFNTFAIPAF